MTRINLFGLLISCFIFSSVKAQKSTKEQNQALSNSVSNNLNEDYAIKQKVFRSALKYGDLMVAKQALFEMIEIKPDEKSLKDSLAYVYINLGSLREAILLSREIVESDPNNTNILEVKAIAEQNLGLSKEALTDYETLYAKLKNVYHLYQIATLQYDLKRLQECNASIDQIISQPEIDKKEIAIGTGTRGQQQKVILKAAALNIKGVLAMDLNEIAIAKVCFDEAVKLSPDFVLAKNNLEFLSKKQAESAEKPKNTSPAAPAKKK
jgi:tetratricopeptide (TPR) repeat protein